LLAVAPGRVLHVIRRQEAEQALTDADRLRIVFGDEVDHARIAHLRVCAAKLVSGYDFAVTCLITDGPVMNICAMRVWMMKSASAGL